MKKKVLALLLVMILILPGCKSKSEKAASQVDSSVDVSESDSLSNVADSKTDDDSNKSDATDNETDSDPSKSGVTDISSDTPDSNTEVRPEYHGSLGEQYADFLGTWYLYSEEVDGDICYATETGWMNTVEFSDDDTITSTSLSVYDMGEPSSVWTTSDINVYESIYSGYTLHAVFQEMMDPDTGYDYFFDTDGNLVEYTIVYYDDEIMTGVWTTYTREAPDFTGCGFDEFLPHDLPEEIAGLIDIAEENERLIVITSPSEELWNECIDNGWHFVDETDNSWIDPFKNPRNVILVNCTDQPLEFEVHDPADGYVPADHPTNEWQPGPFAYCGYLRPGQVYCFVGDVSDTAEDAATAIYFSLESESERWYMTRLFNLDTPHYISVSLD